MINETGTVISLGKTNQGNFSFTIGQNHPGNGEEYSVEHCQFLGESLLKGKNIFWLGSSITYGFGSKGESMADFLAKRNGLCSFKSAISGTTLADISYDPEDEKNPWKHLGRDESSLAETAEQSYVNRLKDFPKEVRPDLFVLQVSTNDSQFPKEYQGKISEKDCWDNFEIHKTFGAVEYILKYVKEVWGCPVLFYTSPLLDSPNYLAMVEATKIICQKWGAELLDMNSDRPFNEVGRKEYDLFMVDLCHPTRAGYLKWWTPAFEQKIVEILKKESLLNG